MNPVTELRAVPHHVRPGVTVFEVWHDGRFVATVTPSPTGAGVNVISKHPIAARVHPSTTGALNVVEVRIGR